MGTVYSVNMLDKRMIHVSGGKEWDHSGCYHAIQNGTQPNSYELWPGVIMNPCNPGYVGG